MSSSKTKRAGTDVMTQPEQIKFRSAKHDAAKTKLILRDKICTTANDYDGKPADYTYVPGYCVKKRNGKPRPPPAGGIPPSQTKKEQQIIKRVLDEYPEGYTDPHIIDNLKATAALFDGMVSSKLRRKIQDPVQRFNTLIKDMPNDMPRQTVFQLMLTHYKALSRR